MQLMSQTWVCSSCRRVLRQQAHTAARNGANQTATYIPFQRPNGAHGGEQEFTDVNQRSRSSRSRRPPSYIDWQFDKSVESDFLQRIAEDRAPKVGPYSRHGTRIRNNGRSGGDHEAHESAGVVPASRTVASSSSRIYRRNGSTPKAHPLEARQSTHQKRPWFGIPSSRSALVDLGHVIPDSSRHMYLNSSLALSASLPGTLDEGGMRHHPSSGEQNQFDQPASFFDQYFDQAREQNPGSATATPLQKAIQDLQNAHHLATPSGNAVAATSSSHKQQQIEEGVALNPVNHLRKVDAPTVGHEHLYSNIKTGTQRASDKADTHPTKPSPKTTTRPSEAYKQFLRLTDPEKSALNQVAINNLCQAMMNAWCSQGQAASRVPKPLKFLQTLNQWRSKDSLASVSTETLWTLLNHAVPRTLMQHTDGVPVAVDLLGSILDVWGFLLQNVAECYVREQNGVIQQLQGELDWDLLARSKQLQGLKQENEGSVKVRLFSLFSIELHSSLQSLDTAALATWALLDVTSQGLSSVNMQHQSLRTLRAFRFFKGLTGHGIVRLKAHEKSLAKRGFNKDERSTLIQRFASLTQVNSRADMTDGKGPAEVISSHPLNPREPSIPSTELFSKRISRATESQDVAKLERVWRKIQSTYNTSNLSATERAQIPAPIYSLLLAGFMALGCPNRAIDIWNDMTASGLKPNVEHWDAMLKGCGIARNAEAVQSVWQNLQEAGLEPDAQLWATRIQSLGSSGRIEAAVQAFQTMAREWVQSQEQKSTNVTSRKNAQAKQSIPKPNTQCLNVLVSLLSRANRHNQLVQVLSWRKALDIPVDSFTYNPLLKAALRDGDTNLASTIVEQMRSQGVNPDVATFTMMLDSAFQQQTNSRSAVDPESPAALKTDSVDPLQLDDTTTTSHLGNVPAVTQQQRSTVESILMLMEQHGIKPTAHTFTTIVSGLLRAETPNATAAYGILRHLSSRGITISPQIYTALVSYSFDQNPPDFAAVEALWRHANNRRQGGPLPILDALFYDRVIEGWARNGETARAMHVRGVARSRGKHQTWDTLRILVESLAEAGQWSEIEKLLSELKREEQIDGSAEARPRRGHAAFRDTVASLGVSDALDDVAGANVVDNNPL